MGNTVAGNQMILGLVVGISILVFLILKTKIHTFLALIISAATTGLVGGMPPNKIIDSISKGFGGTLGSIGIIIGFGVMMGQIFEVSGAAERMARTFIKFLGKKREELALAITGFIVSIPIFCDSGFIILAPLAKAISKKTKKSVVSLGVALGLGLVITHSLVPPTPGPVGVAGIFGVSVGKFILWGIPLAIPMVIAGMFYGKYIGKKIYQIPGDEEDQWIRTEYQEPVYDFEHEEDNKELPSTFMAFAPIMTPIIFILINTILDVLIKQKTITPSGFTNMIQFLGSPIIAVGIGLIIAIYGLAGKLNKEEVINEMEKGIKSAGIIILVTGGGGALGMVLRDSGTGDYIAKSIAGSHMPVVLIPFIIASLVRLIQGSGTVAMITAASITAPIVAASNVNPILAALGACMGSLLFSYFNDSYFWVVNRSLGIKDAKEQIKVWSVTTTIAWAVGLVELIILSFIL
ncbi:GntP family permease [Clostridium botulinum]|uniref:Gluconate permease n=3 Tax=Clostridium botulinum TaxID=1491 RepID=A7GFE3_CLOBL|nr:GntP family permease [Clostridium botulinum]EKX79844.1 gluconate permease [Clostridium botulinum CFSAN001628]ABS40749.1 gluconate permease [Clostridium botulinum F str. Langeland]ACA46177.1 gluconate permease [Clostridium botulinum B1 str. Okra]ADF99904.1 gluconate permease [Clostridium botulinum F str. 230613]APC85300.1 transporter, gluconate:H+ symporter family protein [Clostridium botulinum]